MAILESATMVDIRQDKDGIEGRIKKTLMDAKTVADVQESVTDVTSRASNRSRR